MTLISKSTQQNIIFDLIKARVRLVNFIYKRKFTTTKLHLGCGHKKIDKWLNVDISNSDYNIDLSNGKLPFQSNYFTNIVSQHVIEHLEVEKELIPLLFELFRILKSDGRIILSCPDMRKICKGYLEDHGESLLVERKKRFPTFDLGELPSQHIINDLFHQNGEHKNIFDFEYLEFLLKKCGFRNIALINEYFFLDMHPEFPKRNDDDVSVYIMAFK